MFREKLKTDLDKIHPEKAVLNNITKLMQEESHKPRIPKYIAIMRVAGMAAAVCMIAVGSAVMLNGGASVETADGTAPEVRALALAADMAEYTAVYKGNAVELTPEQAAEIAEAGRKYAENNTAQTVNLAITLEQAEAYGKEGLYFAYDDGGYVGIYISGDDRYVYTGGSCYRFSDSDTVLAYFE